MGTWRRTTPAEPQLSMPRGHSADTKKAATRATFEILSKVLKLTEQCVG